MGSKVCHTIVAYNYLSCYAKNQRNDHGTSKDSDQPGHLIVFVVSLRKASIVNTVKTDQIEQMPRLI